MWRWRIRLQKWLLPAIVALVLVYTADQLLTGERGIVTWRVMKAQVEELRAANDRLREDIQRLERRIALLKPPLEKSGPRLESLSRPGPDADLVDELVRRDLGYIKPGEVIILTGNEQ